MTCATRTALRALTCSLALSFLAGCGGKLTERSVRNFVAEADRAFLKGRTSDICNMRSADFKLTATQFKLAQGHTVSGLAAAEAFEEQRHTAGQRLSSETINMNLKQFCAMAWENHDLYKRATLERTELHIRIDPDGKHATVNAHYVQREPVYAYGSSQLSARDVIEQQVATLQTESDEESTVTRDEHGELVFSTTRAVTKSFQVPQQRDARL